VIGMTTESRQKEPPVGGSYSPSDEAIEEPQPKPNREFLILPEGQVPDGALTWASAEQRKRALQSWRQAIFSYFGNSARAIRVAWVLAELFNVKSGFAFASDGYLAKATGLRRNKLADTLTALQQDRAIIRVHVEINGKMQRRIYPSAALVHPNSGYGGIPQKKGGQNMSGTARLRLPRSQLALARIQAQRKEDEKP
jgi:hypothetical protein